MTESKLQENYAHRLVFVTGPSGAGRSSAINVLEDLGFEAIDNLPMGLLPRVLGGPLTGRSLALGLDVRNRDFSVDALLDLFRSASMDSALPTEMLYLDCRADVLLRRFSETRRRHPLAPAETPELGIEREFALLAPIRAQATVLIDTSELTVRDLRGEIARWFNADPSGSMAVSVQSFSYKRGVPRGVDMVYDCRFLRNPHWDASLRKLDGRDSAVQAYVESDPRFLEFFGNIGQMAELVLPAFREEGKTHVTIAFGCTGGQHRSVAMAEKLANALANAGWQVSMRHREIERHARPVPHRALG